MARPPYDKSIFWAEISVFNEKEVKDVFKSYELCRFTEHKTSGKTPQGISHDCHIYPVVAKISHNSSENDTDKKY